MTKKTKNSDSKNGVNPHAIQISVDDDFDFVDEDPVIPDQKFTLLSFYEPTDDVLTLREICIVEEFFKECLREDPELDKKRVNFSKVSSDKLIKLYHDFRYDNLDEITKKAKERYPDQVFERAVKVRGCFKSQAKANERKNYLKQHDQIHSQYIAETGKWLPFNPPESAIADYETSNRKLNEMMNAHRANIQESKEYYQREKQERIRQSMMVAAQNKKKIMENDEQTIMAEASEQQMLGLIDGEFAKIKRKEKPSKAMNVTIDSRPEAHGISDQVSTKNYSDIKIQKKDFEHNSPNDFVGDAEQEAGYRQSNMAGDMKQIAAAKKDKVRMSMKDFDDAEYDEQLINDLATNIKARRK